MLGLTQASERAKEIQKQLWEGLMEVTANDRSAISASYMKFSQSNNRSSEKRLSSLENRIPRSVWLLIFSVSIIAAFARGLTLAGRFWLTLLLAPLTIALVAALIADLDTPSSGFIRLDQRAMQRLKTDISH